MTKDELLKTISTRELLKQKKWNRETVSLSCLVKGGVSVCHEFTYEEIKEELALRPHIPNKNESRGLRIQKIRQGK